MAAEGRYRRDLPPIMIRFSGMGVRTRPAVPLGRRKPAPPAGWGLGEGVSLSRTPFFARGVRGGYGYPPRYLFCP